jgi:hypothetical protein
MNFETSKGEPQIPPEKKLGIYKKTRDKQYDHEKRNRTCVPLSDGCKMRTKTVRCFALTVKNTHHWLVITVL